MLVAAADRGDAGQNRNDIRNGDNQHRSEKAAASDHEPHPQEQDDAEDRQDTGSENTAKGSELARGLGCIVIL